MKAGYCQTFTKETFRSTVRICGQIISRAVFPKTKCFLVKSTLSLMLCGQVTLPFESLVGPDLTFKGTL